MFTHTYKTARIPLKNYVSWQFQLLRSSWMEQENLPRLRMLFGIKSVGLRCRSDIYPNWYVSRAKAEHWGALRGFVQRQRPTIFIDSRLFYTAFLSITDLSSFKWISYWKVVSLRSTSLHICLLPINVYLVVVYIKKKIVISTILHHLFKQMYVLRCTLIS